MKIKLRTLLLVLALGLATLMCVRLLLTTADGSTRREIRETLLTHLVHVDLQPPGRVADVAYVLGGDQKSLESKFRDVAEYYKDGSVDEIWILGRPGITEYSPRLGRNLTNDEWSIGELRALGVPSEKVEIVTISAGFLGTLSEARDVSERARARGLKSLLLVAQQHHTRRVYVSFKQFLPTTITLYIQGSNGSQSLHEILLELIKLEIYKVWLGLQADTTLMINSISSPRTARGL